MKKQFLITFLMVSSWVYSQVGINTSTPTNTLDVNGTARIRTVNQGVSTAEIYPLYVDNTGVVVKSSTSPVNGGIRSNTVNVASGGTGTLLGSISNGVYKAIIVTGNGCALSASAEFFVNISSFNNYYGLNGQGGFVTLDTNNRPVFTQTVATSVDVTWSGVPGCADGGNATSFNYTLTMPAANTMNIVNNSNVARNYTITLTRVN